MFTLSLGHLLIRLFAPLRFQQPAMDAQGYLFSVISDERRGPDAALLRGALAGLACAYTAGLKLYLFPYRTGLRKQARLPCPVISIGNISVGGTGKTPLVQRVCEFLTARGVKVCVLSRGYRGANEHGMAVVSTETRVELDARSAGDEAYLLARSLPGVPVLVGKDRRKSGALAWERFKPDAIILDDGMQFYQLRRDLEIAALNAARPFDNGWTFPRGLLREPPSHLRRANCVVITHADQVEAEKITALQERLKRLSPRAALYTASYAVEGLRALDRSPAPPLGWLRGRRVASFCALGNPALFEAQLERAGAELACRFRFPDHHSPTAGELQKIIPEACAQGAEAMIVSEKDAVKLPPLGRPLPFYALVARLRLDEEATFFARVLEALGG